MEPLELQYDFLIPKAGNQLLHFRPGAQRSCFEMGRTKLPPAIGERFDAAIILTHRLGRDRRYGTGFDRLFGKHGVRLALMARLMFMERRRSIRQLALYGVHR